jgi:hypothetical protein
MPVRIEASSYRERPVAFEIVGPWTRPQRMAPYEFQRGEQVALLILVATLLSLIVVLNWAEELKRLVPVN